MPAQISAVFNPLFILLLIPVFNYGVYPLIDRVFPLTPLRKIGIGLFVMSAAFGAVALVQMSVDAGNTPHMGIVNIRRGHGFHHGLGIRLYAST